MQSIDSKIQNRIYGRGKGCVVRAGPAKLDSDISGKAAL